MQSCYSSCLVGLGQKPRQANRKLGNAAVACQRLQVPSCISWSPAGRAPSLTSVVCPAARYSSAPAFPGGWALRRLSNLLSSLCAVTEHRTSNETGPTIARSLLIPTRPSVSHEIHPITARRCIVDIARNSSNRHNPHSCNLPQSLVPIASFRRNKSSLCRRRRPFNFPQPDCNASVIPNSNSIILISNSSLFSDGNCETLAFPTIITTAFPRKSCDDFISDGSTLHHKHQTAA